MDQYKVQSSSSSAQCSVTDSQKWMIFIAMCTAIFIIAFATTATTNAMIPIRLQMHLDPSQLQWTTNSYILAASVLMVLGGLLSDRYGRRNMNFLGGIIFVAGSIVCATATAGTQFIIGRFIQGVGVAVVMPGSLALMKVVFSEDEQGIVTTGWAIAVGLGMGLGPFFSGIFCETVGWEYLFALIGAVMLFSMILLVVSIRRRFPTNNLVTIDYLGLSVFLVGFSFLVYALVEGTTAGWGNPLIISFIVVGVILMLLQPSIEKHVHRTPFINFDYFKRPRFALGCIGMYIDGYFLIGILYFGNLYLQNPILLNYSAYQAGLAVIPLGAGLSISVLFVERLYARIGIPMCLQFSFIMLMIGSIWFICLNTHTSYGLIWEAFFFVGVGCGMATKAFPAMAIQALSKDEAARSASVVSAFLYIGVIFSTVIGTILSLAFVRDYFTKLTAHIPGSVTFKAQLQHAILTAPATFQKLVVPLPSMERAHYTVAGQIAALKGFHYAMISSLVFLAVAMFAANVLLKRKEYDPNK